MIEPVWLVMFAGHRPTEDIAGQTGQAGRSVAEISGCRGAMLGAGRTTKRYRQD